MKFLKILDEMEPALELPPYKFVFNSLIILYWFKGLVTPSNGFVTEEKRIKHAEFGYPVTKFISSDARDSSDRFVERLSHIMTVHQTGVSIRFIPWKVLNMFKT